MNIRHSRANSSSQAINIFRRNSFLRRLFGVTKTNQLRVMIN